MLTQSEIRNLTNYNEKTGEFTWSDNAHKKVRGKKVGTPAGNGYLLTKVNYKRHMVHRLIWLYVYGEFPDGDIDHINRVRDDNRISNLRDVKRYVNLANSSKRKDNISGVTGVRSQKGGRWEAYIHINKKRIPLGSYSDKLGAINARIEYERSIFGELSRNS